MPCIIRTWFHVVTQMLQRVNDFSVTLLLHVIRVELRPAWVRQYWYEYVVQHATSALYVVTAVVPRATA